MCSLSSPIVMPADAVRRHRSKPQLGPRVGCLSATTTGGLCHQRYPSPAALHGVRPNHDVMSARSVGSREVTEVTCSRRVGAGRGEPSEAPPPSARRRGVDNGPDGAYGSSPLMARRSERSRPWQNSRRTQLTGRHRRNVLRVNPRAGEPTRA